MNYQEAIEALRLEGGLEIEGNLKKVAKFFDGLDTAIKALKEIHEYKKLGIFEEVRDAVEKQKAKKPNLIGDGYADGKLVYDTYECPNCGKEYEIDYEEYDYCPKCGQHIDWSEQHGAINRISLWKSSNKGQGSSFESD